MSQFVEIKAGTLTRAAVFPDKPRRSRSPKAKPTSFWMEKVNIRHAFEKLMWLIASNFQLTDWMVSLDYDDAHLPRNRDDAVAQCKKFIRSLRASRKPFGRILMYVYVTEGQHGDHRLHHHIIMNRFRGETEILRKIWKNGGVDWVPIGKLGYEGIARYLTKEPRQHGRLYVGDNIWAASRNLKKPVVVITQVDDSFKPDLPTNAFDVTERIDKNPFGEFYYCDYKIPFSAVEKQH